jgi:hypothetical protein
MGLEPTTDPLEKCSMCEIKHFSRGCSAIELRPLKT